jgi:2-dehydro-3-deoxyphosphogluconate aldolase/(4S)-4-hydroxy-2-oxoglutarate aldolase
MITNPQQVMDTIERGGVLPVVRLPSLERAATLAQTLLEAGVTAFEVTLTSPGALEALQSVRAGQPAFEAGRAVIGAGSVVSPDQAAAAIDCGAQFIVTPVMQPRTIAACVDRRIPIIPGALTPTEIQAAWEAGASAVKVFPAHLFGPTYLKDLLAPLPHLKLVPTGGVTLENAGEFIRRGAAALGIGSSLVSPRLVDAEEWERLAANARAFLDAVQAARIKP